MVSFSRAAKALIIGGIALCSFDCAAQFYNGMQMTFGKNRVQYEPRFWSFYRYKNFEAYYYVGGKELAEFTGSVAQNDIDEIQKLYDFTLEGKIQFLIFNKLSDAKQSNIGLESDETLQNNIGGYTRIVGNKVFVYFDGSHANFHRQIRGGIARVMLDEIMYGGDIRERLQNAALLFMPDWYDKGLVSYVSYPWDTKIDNLMREGVVSGKYLKLNRLSGTDAMIAGHSMWRYIVETYGEQSVSNLLYMTRLNRNIESGMQFVLGVSLKDLVEDWEQWLLAQYSEKDKEHSTPQGNTVIKKTKKALVYNQVRVSPDGRHSVFVLNDLGKYKVRITENATRKTKKILKGGYRSYAMETDESFPLVAWHPSGKIVAVIRERKGKIWLGTYTLDTKKYEESQLFNFEKVLDFSYSDDGHMLVMSAVQKGQSDIFIYNLRTRTYEQVTRDAYDDLHPRFFRSMSAIVFSSNRENDSLDAKSKPASVEGSYDIFMYDYARKSNLLKRMTSTEGVNEIRPVQYDSVTVAYLTDRNGMYNRSLARLDSVISFIDTTEHYRYVITTKAQTDYYRSILTHDVNYYMNKLSEVVLENGRMKMYMQDMKSWDETSLAAPPGNTAFRSKAVAPASTQVPAETVVTDVQPQQEPKQETTEPAKTDTGKVDINNYVFQSEFETSKRKKEESKKVEVTEVKPAEETTQTLSSDSAAVQPVIKPRNYELVFAADYVVTQVDNGLVNSTYQSFVQGGVGYYNPGLNGFLKLGISDLMDDYKITGGIRITGDLNGSEYFLSFENLKRRLDKQLVLYRHSESSVSPSFVWYRLKTHEAIYRVKWPFTEVSSVRGSLSYRNDRLIILSSEIQTMLEPDQERNWISPKVEYVYDNTISTGLNLYNGTRLKVFGEYFTQVDEKESDMFVIGADIRHYQKVHRQIIWANRLAASTSFGNQKIVYFMGGTDNWINASFDNSIPIDFSQNYAYQAVATPMRGFEQNIRNGNNFALINTELRIPVFTYLLNRPVKSDFLRNFMVVGFGDIGTAWTGTDPYDTTNSLNNTVINYYPYTITLYYQREPIVYGYGFGLRSRVLGYYLKVDWAWGVEDAERLPQRLYFSLSLDF
jgi:hypothetical protein